MAWMSEGDVGMGYVCWDEATTCHWRSYPFSS